MHASKLFMFCHRHVPGSLSQCIWLACSIKSLTVGKPKYAVSIASSLSQTMNKPTAAE